MPLNPYTQLVIAALIWGSAGAVVKILNLPSTTLTAFRLIVPVVLLGMYFYTKHIKVTTQVSKLVLFASLINGIRLFFYFLAYSFTTISNAVIIINMSPIFITLFSGIFFKEKVTKNKIYIIAMAFVGVILMYSNKAFSFANKDFLGMSAMLVSTALYSLTVPIFKKELVKYSPEQTVFYQNIVGAILFLPFLFINKPFPNMPQSLSLIVYAILIGLVSFFLFFSALKVLKASTASVFIFIEPLCGVILGILLFKDVLTIPMIAGGGLILLSSFLVKKID